MTTTASGNKKKMATTKKSRVIKIDSKNLVAEQPKWFAVDWNKVKSVSDVKAILENMGLGCFENATF